jgi:hypothetical protein
VVVKKGYKDENDSSSQRIESVTSIGYPESTRHEPAARVATTTVSGCIVRQVQNTTRLVPREPFAIDH